MTRLYVILAIFPTNDADTVAVCADKEGAIASWRKYLTDSSGEPNGDELDWLNRNAQYLRDHGKSERQDSGVFYRLNPMSAVAP